MPLRSIACVLLAATAFSCAPRRSDVSPGTPSLLPTLLLDQVARRNAGLRTLVGRGSLTFDSPEVAGSAFFRSSLKRPDSLLVLLQGPFGMDVGTFFLSDRRYVVYNAIENLVQTGDPATSAIRSFIPFDLSAEDLVNVFGGMFPLPHDTAGIRIVEFDADVTHLALGCGDGQCEYWVDTGRLAVTRMLRRNAAGEVQVDMEARDFKEYDGIALPRQLRLEFPGAMRTLSVYYSSLSPNGDPPSFAFTIPSGARTRRP